MASLIQVDPKDNFKLWRERTNEIIDLVNVNLVGSPTLITTIRDLLNYVETAGVFSGCAVTNNFDGTVDVAVGEGLLRISNSDSAEITSAVIPAVVNLALTDNNINYVYADYNAGVPQVLADTNASTVNENDKCLIAIISREGTDLTILEAQEQNVNQNKKIQDMLIETDGFKPVLGGSRLEDKGNKRFGISSGGFYRALKKYNHAAVDTSGADTFEYYYRDGGGGWTEVLGQTVIDALNWDDDSGILQSLTAGKYSTHWIYFKVGGNQVETYVVYGRAEHDTVADARAEQEPADLPPQLGDLGVLLGRIIILQNATSFASIESAFSTAFVPGLPSDHNNLSNLQGGVAGERYHLSSSEHANVLAHLSDTGNPHSVTYDQVGADPEGSAVAMALALGGA